MTSATATPDGITVVTQPQSTRAGRFMTPAPSFQITSAGTALKLAGVSVTLSPATGPGPVAGTTTVTTDVNGRATFSSIYFKTAGAYTLKAALTTGQFDTTAVVNIRDIPYSITANYGTLADFREPTLGYDIPYQLFIPHNATSATPVPIIVYGHSSAGYASVNTMANAMKIDGLPTTVTANKATFPFFMVMPQIPVKAAGARESWRRAIAPIVKTLRGDGYNVDTTRIYFVGYSTGGIEGVHLAYKYPTYFAAIVADDPGWSSLDLTGTSIGATVGNGTAAPGYGIMAASWYDATAWDDGSHGGPDTMSEWARVVAAGHTSIMFLHGTSPTEVTPLGTSKRDIGNLAPVVAKFANYGVTFSTTASVNNQTTFNNIATDKYVYSLWNATSTSGLTHAQMNTMPTSYTGDPALYNWLALQHR